MKWTGFAHRDKHWRDKGWANWKWRLTQRCAVVVQELRIAALGKSSRGRRALWSPWTVLRTRVMRVYDVQLNSTGRQTDRQTEACSTLRSCVRIWRCGVTNNRACLRFYQHEIVRPKPSARPLIIIIVVVIIIIIMIFTTQELSAERNISCAFALFYPHTLNSWMTARKVKESNPEHTGWRMEYILRAGRFTVDITQVDGRSLRTMNARCLMRNSLFGLSDYLTENTACIN